MNIGQLQGELFDEYVEKNLSIQHLSLNTQLKSLHLQEEMMKKTHLTDRFELFIAGKR